jgi:hypothetical protein
MPTRIGQECAIGTRRITVYLGFLLQSGIRYQEVAKAKEYPGTDYDLVAFFDCLHDMGDPVGAAIIHE